MRIVSMAALALAALPSVAKAADCRNYPFAEGISIDDIEGSMEIVATVAIPVSLDDIDSVSAAREEATIEATSLILSFMTKGIHHDEAARRIIDGTRSMQGENKAVMRSQLIVKLGKLNASPQAILRGARLVGECYTEERQFRVSIGIKPDMIESSKNGDRRKA